MDAVKGNAAWLGLAFGYVMTTRGMPEIYSGDEIAMPGGDDPDNRREFPGGFPGAPANAFEAGVRTTQQEGIYTLVSQLAAIRRAHEALQCGGEQVLASNADWIVYERDSAHPMNQSCAAGDRVVVAIHRGAAPASLSVPLAQTWAAGCFIRRTEIGGTGSSATISGDLLTLKAAGDDVLIAACK